MFYYLKKSKFVHQTKITCCKLSDKAFNKNINIVSLLKISIFFFDTTLKFHIKSMLINLK